VNLPIFLQCIKTDVKSDAASGFGEVLEKFNPRRPDEKDDILVKRF